MSEHQYGVSGPASGMGSANGSGAGTSVGGVGAQGGNGQGGSPGGDAQPGMQAGGGQQAYAPGQPGGMGGYAQGQGGAGGYAQAQAGGMGGYPQGGQQMQQPAGMPHAPHAYVQGPMAMPQAAAYAPPGMGYMGYAGGMPPQYAAYAGIPPHAMYAGQAMPGMPMGAAPGQAQGQGRGPGMAEVMEDIANGDGISGLSKMLNFDDTEFWKGALIGAAAVLLLTNETVQDTLFKTGVKAKDAVKSGVDKVKTKLHEAEEQVEAAKSDD